MCVYARTHALCVRAVVRLTGATHTRTHIHTHTTAHKPRRTAERTPAEFREFRPFNFLSFVRAQMEHD